MHVKGNKGTRRGESDFRPVGAFFVGHDESSKAPLTGIALGYLFVVVESTGKCYFRTGSLTFFGELNWKIATHNPHQTWF